MRAHTFFTGTPACSAIVAWKCRSHGTLLHAMSMSAQSFAGDRVESNSAFRVVLGAPLDSTHPVGGHDCPLDANGACREVHARPTQPGQLDAMCASRRANPEEHAEAGVALAQS
ncbi:MAG: hypothetical protein ACKV2O_21690 [Acidimicrobiales bacterium]